MTEHAVVIAGAGPTGLMLAGELALARVDGKRVRVLLIEPHVRQGDEPNEPTMDDLRSGDAALNGDGSLVVAASRTDLTSLDRDVFLAHFR